MKTSNPGDWKKLRTPDYKLRIEAACDQSPHCPDVNFGRLAWLAAELHKRGHSVSRESVKRWLHGEVRPRQDKSDAIAEILGVDPVWLFSGADVSITPRQRRLLTATVTGAVNIVAGIVQMDGAAIAFPEESDPRAEFEKVDFYAIIRGVNYAFNVALAEKEGDGYIFRVPANSENIVVLGLIRDGTNFTVLEIPRQLISEGKNNAGGVDVKMTAAQVAEARVEDFTKRL